MKQKKEKQKFVAAAGFNYGSDDRRVEAGTVIAAGKLPKAVEAVLLEQKTLVAAEEFKAEEFKKESE